MAPATNVGNNFTTFLNQLSMTQAQVLKRLRASLKKLAAINKQLAENETEELKAKRDRLMKDINLTAKLYGKRSL